MVSQMKISYGTIKNTKQQDKPNEDLVFCDLDRNIFILLDGVSRDTINGEYPFPSPAAEATEILKANIHKELSVTLGNVRDRIVTAMMKANAKVQEYNREHILDFAAGAVGIIGVIEDQRFYYAYIGDCYGRVITGDKVEIFTTCQTQEIARHKREYSTYEIRHIICNNIKHPCGYGVLNGDERAYDFIQSGVIDCANIDQIILSSDGMEGYLSGAFIGEIYESTAQELIIKAMRYNNKAQDDRSVIKIEKEHLLQ